MLGGIDAPAKGLSWSTHYYCTNHNDMVGCLSITKINYGKVLHSR